MSIEQSEMIIIALLLLASLPNIPKEAIVEIEIPQKNEVYDLLKKIDLAIIDAQENFITAYADSEKFSQLKTLGYKVKILIKDYQKYYEEFFIHSQAYHSYSQVCSIMRSVNQSYPTITQLETLGYSVAGREILGMKITDNPQIEEPEPEIRLIGAHHGNEKISTEITLDFLQFLTREYATNPQVQELVNNREIWIIPILNVDGHIANRRTNNNGVDLNRDYGYMWENWGASPQPFSQPETRAIQKNSEENNFVLEYAFHSTASYVNYLWDHHPFDPPDSILIIGLSRIYADSTYGSSLTRLVPINGYDWYEVHGSCQDASFGLYGTLAWTIETQQPAPRIKVDSICLANRRALLGMISIANFGVSGIVRDSFTGEPLSALIEFLPLRWITYSDRAIGDFYKMLAPGDYLVKISAIGYQSKIFNVTVPNQGSVNLEVNLRPSFSDTNWVSKIVWVRQPDPNHINRTLPIYSLGEPDDKSLSLGVGGTIVFEIEPTIQNLFGNDIIIYEGDTIPEPYTVYGALDWFGTWYSLGPGLGTTGFDLSSAGLDSIRYLKIIDAGGGSNSDPFAGFDLDAVQYFASGRPANQEKFSNNLLTLNIKPNPASQKIIISYSLPKKSRLNLKVYDCTGRLQAKLFEGEQKSGNYTSEFRIPRSESSRNGVYFCQLTTESQKITRKIIINK